jgi:hypothetical protein
VNTRAAAESTTAIQAVADSAAALANTTPALFDPTTTPILIATLLFGGTLVGFVLLAQRGRELYIRRIAGLEAVDEAVGRATEMGRPILFSPGLEAMEEVSTVAAMNVLGEVARRVARYGTPLIVPNRDPVVMTVAQQVVRDAFMAEGVPERYHQEDVYYTTQSQFGYAAAVCGVMLRDRPAANFFFGRFYAESLVLTETGNLTGAIQIAGTDADAQLPFFICSCDYTLMGEELYAGSVYLSREPLLLGALKAQDMGKVAILVVLVLGSILTALGVKLPAISK